MKLEAIDQYATLRSPFHSWDPRCKLIGFMALIFAFSFVRDLRVLLAMAVATITIYLVSGLPVSFIVSRLRYPSLFLLVVVLILPLVSGQTIVTSIGPLGIRQEGLNGALLIATRFLAILTTGSVLFGTAPFLTTIKAMRALGLPAILADMVLLAFRYLHEIGDDLQRMQMSMKLRGVRSSRFNLRSLRIPAWMSGSMLVRSYERSDSIYKAMVMRGYGHATHYRDDFHARASDISILVVFLLAAGGFVVGEMICGRGSVPL